MKKWPAEGPKLVWLCDTVGDGFSSTAIQDQMESAVDLQQDQDL